MPTGKLKTTLDSFLTCLLCLSAALVFIAMPFIPTADAQQSGDAELAQELVNPLADLMTLPIQMTYDRNIGVRDDGTKLTTNVQPVIPFSLNPDWNIISRTIVPIISQEDIYPDAGSQFGLGDITLSLFFSPRKPTTGGVIWGAGPVLLFPTATDDRLGADKWGLGPTAVVLTMKGPWTFGGLGNHVWSYEGVSYRADISNTFLQPFAAYTTPNAFTISLQSESNYNWNSETWSIPVNVAFAKLVRWGKLPVSLQAGVGYWLDSPDTGPEGWRFRLQANFVLPGMF